MANIIWPDGSKNHTISWARHLADMAAPKATSPASAAGPVGHGGASTPLGVPPVHGASSPPQGTVAIGSTPVTQAQWQSGVLANALVPGATAPGGVAGPAALPPPDPTLEGQIASEAQRRDDALAGYAAARPQALADYGYKATGYDSAGNPTGLTFNADDPYSQAALLKKRYDQNKVGAQNAAGNQIFSGSYQNTKIANESGYGQSSDALTKALTKLLASIASGEASAKTTYEANVANDRAARAPTS